jgi:dihydrofolate synthase/folylpolyglutamate synthase
MNTYQEIVSYLFTLTNFKEKGFTQWLASQLLYPYSFYPTIHIAGTNGKGSVSHKIAKALEYSGYRVGLLTSPHVHSFCERVVINGEMISEEEVVKKLKFLFSLCERGGWEPTFFHLALFLGFQYFVEQHVDVAVVETGIGGRLDTTNIIKPLVSIITSIGKDHQALLGETLEAIAAEKAGVIKYKTPVVVGPSAVYPIIFQKAAEKKAPIYPVKGSYAFYDEENSAIAAKALELIHATLPLNSEAIARGLLERPFYRYQTIHNVIFDVAHNVDGFKKLLDVLQRDYGDEKFHFIYAGKPDKDRNSILHMIQDRAVQIDVIRAYTKSEIVLPSTLSLPITTHLSIEESLKGALAKGRKIVVCGTFALMDPAKRALEKIVPLLL